MTMSEVWSQEPCLLIYQPPTTQSATSYYWTRYTEWHQISSSQISSGTCSPIDDTLSNSTTKIVDGASEEWSSPRKCAITCALQHLHKWPTNTQGHSEFHLRRRLVYCDIWCIIWEDRISPQRSIKQHWRLLREEPFACQPRQDTDMRIPPQEQTAEHIMVW